MDGPEGSEIAGLRRGLGDPSLGAIPSHITLVPPVNVRSAEVPDAMAVLRDAASKVDGPIGLTLGPPRTFMPDNPVVYLEVGGEAAALKDLAALRDLAALHEAVFIPPLRRKLSWPWVPHVTILDGAEPEAVEAAVRVLGSYVTQVSFERVVILEMGSDRTWAPLADVLFGPRVRVGTGGLAVELTYSRLPDPELATVGEWPGLAGSDGATPVGRPGGLLLPPLFLAARREGSLAGAAGAWVDRTGPVVSVWVRQGVRGQGIGATMLAHLESRLRREGWKFAQLAARGPAGFFERCSAWTVPAQR